MASKRVRRVYSPEFKREAVRRMQEQRGAGTTLAQVSRAMVMVPPPVLHFQADNRAVGGEENVSANSAGVKGKWDSWGRSVL